MKINRVKDCITPQATNDLLKVGYWPPTANPSDAVPIYHAFSLRAFNQVVGYAKFINGSNGTVLYRGQSENHNSLLPSGARPSHTPVPDETINAIRNDDKLTQFFKLNDDIIKGWETYQSILIESVLQHYGADTYCMDFVDNHWCALWFGLYKFVDNHYEKRMDPGEKLYIYLYLADTNGSCVRGMYIGEDTYTVDLRKALPSTFSRPAAQHGWIVRKHMRENCNYDDRVIGVVEIDVDHAAKWLGEGELLSQDNFFPNFSDDQGYKVLLWRQKRSGVPSKWTKILPVKTICNYHYSNTFFTSGNYLGLKPLFCIKTDTGKNISNITDLFSLMLEKGWCKETCLNEDLWSEDNPAIGQSFITAVLVQKCFGGKIISFNYSTRKHYFNLIKGCYIDLTYEELNPVRRACYPPETSIYELSNSSKPYIKNYNKLKILTKNCGLSSVRLLAPRTMKKSRY